MILCRSFFISSPLYAKKSNAFGTVKTKPEFSRGRGGEAVSAAPPLVTTLESTVSMP